MALDAAGQNIDPTRRYLQESRSSTETTQRCKNVKRVLNVAVPSLLSFMSPRPDAKGGQVKPSKPPRNN